MILRLVVLRLVVLRLVILHLVILRNDFTLGEFLMRRTNLPKTAVFAAFFLAFFGVATFLAKPAQAEVGAMAGYKYISVDSSLGYSAHVAQMDIMLTVGGGGKGYRAGGRRPYHAIGLGAALGGNSARGKEALGSLYFAIPFTYEYVFSNGLGFSTGLTVPLMAAFGEGGGGFGTGVALSDLGVHYHFKSGWTLYAKTNLGYARFFEIDGEDADEGSATDRDSEGSENTEGPGGLMWGVGVGFGYWF